MIRKAKDVEPSGGGGKPERYLPHIGITAVFNGPSICYAIAEADW